ARPPICRQYRVQDLASRVFVSDAGRKACGEVDQKEGAVQKHDGGCPTLYGHEPVFDMALDSRHDRFRERRLQFAEVRNGGKSKLAPRCGSIRRANGAGSRGNFHAVLTASPVSTAMPALILGLCCVPTLPNFTPRTAWGLVGTFMSSERHRAFRPRWPPCSSGFAESLPFQAVLRGSGGRERLSGMRQVVEELRDTRAIKDPGTPGGFGRCRQKGSLMSRPNDIGN